MYSSEIKEALLQVSELDDSITKLNEQIHRLQGIKKTIQLNLLSADAEVEKIATKLDEVKEAY